MTMLRLLMCIFIVDISIIIRFSFWWTWNFSSLLCAGLAWQPWVSCIIELLRVVWMRSCLIMNSGNFMAIKSLVAWVTAIHHLSTGPTRVAYSSAACTCSVFVVIMSLFWVEHKILGNLWFIEIPPQLPCTSLIAFSLSLLPFLFLVWFF